MVNEPSSTAATPSSAATETGRTTVDELIEARAEIERLSAEHDDLKLRYKTTVEEELAESNLAAEEIGPVGGRA